MLQEPRGCYRRSHARRLRRVHAPTFTSSDRTSLKCATCSATVTSTAVTQTNSSLTSDGRNLIYNKVADKYEVNGSHCDKDQEVRVNKELMERGAVTV
ncbi:unnamed protein product [Eruca vesicaria subsp. sativa]|uniref:Uncharacterized protein n=1 Tax=Eruca vesicaria subsp. sativa TaxID=29727 RepID=A0ABC8KCN9_ERUVS|nr:unnamed protein product [Eruca vesicaria subsp. sativa]